MTAFAHSVLLMILASTMVIALHSTSPKRARGESVTEDRTDMVETEPSSHNEEDAQWHRLKNQVDAKLSQLSNKMEAQVTKLSNRMAELSKEVKAEMAVLNNDVTRLKRRADASQNIRASERSCSGKTSYEFSASNPSNGIYSFKWRQEGQVDIQLSWRLRQDSMIVYMLDSDSGSKESLSGPLKEMERIFSDVLPFPGLFNKIKEAFDSRMTEGKCIDLMLGVAFDRPAGIPWSEGWVVSFIYGRITVAETNERRTAARLARREDRKAYPVKLAPTARLWTKPALLQSRALRASAERAGLLEPNPKTEDDHVVTANIQREVETIYIECGRVTNLRSQHFSERRLSGTFVNPGLFGA
ncbi:hypothetical protein FOZ61_002835 [Perkinsus olseni]|uniref:Uncharacterized protein n=1 Tax=Perkinsus olseni TaxID=32597 RepID=A0A7J6LRP2_PEROL|nr:hypothetical protein FOZ61_002835 [Perkinsus olseni]